MKFTRADPASLQWDTVCLEVWGVGECVSSGSAFCANLSWRWQVSRAGCHLVTYSRARSHQRWPLPLFPCEHSWASGPAAINAGLLVRGGRVRRWTEVRGQCSVSRDGRGAFLRRPHWSVAVIIQTAQLLSLQSDCVWRWEQGSSARVKGRGKRGSKQPI